MGAAAWLMMCWPELLAGEWCLLAGCGHIHLWIIHLEGFQVCYNDALKPVKLQIPHTGHPIAQRVHLIPHTPLSHHSSSTRHQSILWRHMDRPPSLMNWCSARCRRNTRCFFLCELSLPFAWSELSFAPIFTVKLTTLTRLTCWPVYTVYNVTEGQASQRMPLQLRLVCSLMVLREEYICSFNLRPKLI